MNIFKTKDDLFLGPVKKITSTRQGEDEEWNEKKIYCYDNDGYIIHKERETLYDDFKADFHYNSKKQLTERIEWIGDYQIIERSFYDSKGNLVEIVRMNSENEIIFRNVYEYNDKGFKNAFIQYKGDGSISEKDEYYYDNHGQLIKEISHNYFKSIYIYNSNHNLIEKTDYSGYDLDRKEKYIIDINGNKTEQSVSQCGKTWITKFFYNELNQMTKSIEYKTDGSINIENTFKYDRFGNEVYYKRYSYNRRTTIFEESSVIEYY